jgi:hypothetical protein
MGQIQHLSTCCHMRVGSWGKPPGMCVRVWAMPRVDEGGGMGRQVAKSRLPVPIVG